MVSEPDRGGPSLVADEAAGAETTAVLFLTSLLLQLSVLAVVAAVLRWQLPESALVAVSGGALALLANLVFGVLVLGRRRGAAGAVMAAFLVAEVVKFGIVAVGFALIVRFFVDQLTGLNALLLFGVFGLTLGAQWAAPLVTGLCTDGRRR